MQKHKPNVVEFPVPPPLELVTKPQLVKEIYAAVVLPMPVVVIRMLPFALLVTMQVILPVMVPKLAVEIITTLIAYGQEVIVSKTRVNQNLTNVSRELVLPMIKRLVTLVAAASGPNTRKTPTAVIAPPPVPVAPGNRQFLDPAPTAAAAATNVSCPLPHHISKDSKSS